MAEQSHGAKASPDKIDSLRYGLLFVGVGILIFGMVLGNWAYDLKPRLGEVTETNARILAASHAKAIESQFRNIGTAADIRVIHDSIKEMLTIKDPETGENLYLGIALVVDYDVFPAQYDMIDIELGMAGCNVCIYTENPIYTASSTRPAAVLKIYANPVFYDRLMDRINVNLTLMLIIVAVILAAAWLGSNRLLRRLRQRERKLFIETNERRVVEERLEQISAYDQLTSLPNRNQLQSDLARKIRESGRDEITMAVLFFDIDHFKEINDLYGHESGDILLQEVARRIADVTRNYDLLARFGGDEFVMAMTKVTNKADVRYVAEKIIACFRPAFKLPNREVNIQASIGIAIYPEDGDTPSELLKNADAAMHRAKAEGRNCYQFYSAEMNLELQYSKWVETHLREAIDQDKFELYLQPQLNLETGAVVSCEALIRWPQEGGERLSPADFIQIAERSTLINEISLWVLNRACKLVNRWREQGYDPVRIDINLSSKDFNDGGVLANFQKTLRRHHLRPNHIGIEITENLLIESSEQVIEALATLHTAGVHISIDDFGTGFSSLNYIKQLPLSCLKIDQSFVRDAPSNREDRVLLEAITLVGQGFGLEVVAEGVETDWHQQLCRQIGCHTIQGNHVAEPLPPDAFAERFLGNGPVIAQSAEST